MVRGGGGCRKQGWSGCGAGKCEVLWSVHMFPILVLCGHSVFWTCSAGDGTPKQQTSMQFKAKAAPLMHPSLLQTTDRS